MSFTISVAPTWQRLRSKVGIQRDIVDLAYETMILSPAIDVEEKAALALPGELDHVETVRNYTNFDEQRAFVAGGVRHHLPTIAYRYRDALLADGTIYVKGGYESVARRQRRPIIAERAKVYSSAMLCADIGSDMFFGRWLRDSLAKELLAGELGRVPLNQPNGQRIHEPGYRAILGLEADRPDVARIDDLLIVDDRGYNHDHVRRFRALRARLAGAVREEGEGLVYMARGTLATAGRGIVNAAAVEEALRALGFNIIHPEEMAPHEICAVLSGARLVVSVEGSALAHVQLAMPSGGTIIAIQPSNRFSTAHKSVAEVAGLRFGFVVAKAREDGLLVDLDRLCRTIDLVDRSV